MNVKFYNIDLNECVGALNPFSYGSVKQNTNIINVVFDQSDKGDNADVYRSNCRDATLEFFKTYCPEQTFPVNFNLYFSKNPDLKESAKKFHTNMKVLAEEAVMNTVFGINFKQAREEGAVIYIKGHLEDDDVQTIQKIVLIHLLDVYKNSYDKNSRHVCLFIDELKNIISRPVLNALSALNGFGVNLIFNIQSINDLLNCPTDCHPESVKAQVLANTSLKFFFKCLDPDTADWVERLSGKILVKSDADGSWFFLAKDSWRTNAVPHDIEVYRFDSNLLLNLPRYNAVYFEENYPRLIHVSPVDVSNEPDEIPLTIFDEVPPPPFQPISAEDKIDVGN